MTRVVRSSEEIDALLDEVEQELKARGESTEAGLPDEELVAPAGGRPPEPPVALEADKPAKLPLQIGAIEIKDLAQELDVEPKALRKWLRKSGKSRNGGGKWAWDEGDPELSEIRSAFAKTPAGG